MERRGIRVRRSALTLFVCLLLLPRAALAEFPSTASRVRTWAPEHIGRDHSHTRREALRAARRFDTIVAVRGAYRGYMDDMRAVNPDLVLLVYLNGAFALENQRSAFPRRWYARTATGRKIRSQGYGNYLMLPSRRGWVRHVRIACSRFRSHGPYDGCFVDMLGTALLEPGYLTGRPINPATGRMWTKLQWLKATSALAAAVWRRIDPHLVAPNGLRNGSAYFDGTASSQRLIEVADGGCAESWLRSAHRGVRDWPSEQEWKRNIDMLADAAAQGKSVLVLTKLWVRATDTQTKKWHRLALASFLLGDDGRSYFSFSGSPRQSPTRAHPWWNVNLGAPLAPYAKVGGVYQRTFERGMVVVNPTNDKVTVALPGRYLDLSGTELGRITLGPLGAEVLRTL